MPSSTDRVQFPSFTQGERVEWPVTETQPGSPSAVDLTGVTIEAEIRDTANGSVVATWSVEETDLANGQYKLILTPAKTAAIEITKSPFIQQSFLMDIKYTHPGSPQNIEVKATGHVVVKRLITRG